MLRRKLSPHLQSIIYRSLANWEIGPHLQQSLHHTLPDFTHSSLISLATSHCISKRFIFTSKTLFSQDLRTEEPKQLTEIEYHKIADATLEDLSEKLEIFLESLDLDEGDVEYSQGVLTVKLGGLGTYVINKQTPNRQIWMSSPASGPVRYDYEKGRWVYRRDGHAMHERIENELEKLTGNRVDLNPCNNCHALGSCTDGSFCLKT